MKFNKLIYIAIILLSIGACTDKFDDINTRPDVFYDDEVSGKFFLTRPQFRLYAPDRFPYWRAQLIHADRYAGHFTFGHSNSWWSDELGYSYNSGYTDASWGWLEGYLGDLDNFMQLTGDGGKFENEYMYAMGLILKGLYYQMFTDAFGMIPYSEAADPDIVTPKFDAQIDIYKGIIADLEAAIEIIGDQSRTGVGVDDVEDNDVFFGGDLQKWKRMANSLILRLALRAYGAEGEDFSQTAITNALARDLMTIQDDNCLMKKDIIISQWGSASYGDVWHNFGGGSDWTVGQPLIDLLRNNNDPRLSVYAQPAIGDTVLMYKPDGPEGDLYDKRVSFITGTLTDAGASFEGEQINDTTYQVVLAPNQFVGQPVRLNDKIQSFANFNLFCRPANIIIQKKNEDEPISPEIVFTTAESYFLRAEAAVRGLSGENAAVLYEEGIKQAMLMWGLAEGAANDYISNSDLGKLTGSTEEQLEKIALQRYMAAYTDGFEAWAIVRDTGYPSELAAGVSDVDIFGLGDLNGLYPQRMRYGSQTWDKNGDETAAAVAIQGPDVQATKLWWAK